MPQIRSLPHANKLTTCLLSAAVLAALFSSTTTSAMAVPGSAQTVAPDRVTTPSFGRGVFGFDDFDYDDSKGVGASPEPEPNVNSHSRILLSRRVTGRDRRGCCKVTSEGSCVQDQRYFGQACGSFYGHPRNLGKKFCNQNGGFRGSCPETCSLCLEETTTTTTTTAEPTTEGLEEEPKTTTIAATTIPTNGVPGTTCDANDQCASAVCKTHCCATSEACSACTNTKGDGQCYATLSIGSSWNPDTALTNGWVSKYNKGELRRIEGPQDTFAETMVKNRKGAASDIKYRLLWESPDATTSDDFVGGTPPEGLLPSGEGADPGLFEADDGTGQTTALPRRNGEYTAYLVVEDKAGTAVAKGLPHRFDQAVIKKWTFTVAGKPDFVIKSFSRTKEGLDDVNVGDAPYITVDEVVTLKATVGTTYHVAPIDGDSLQHEHASGGDDAKIKFTVRNQPPGFFIDPETGEIQGTPKPASTTVGANTYATELLAVDPSGAVALLERIQISILAKPLFKPVFKSERTISGSDYADPSAAAQRTEPFRVGQSYRIATLALDAAASTVSAGEVGDITYTLSSDAIDSFFVQASSGIIFGTFPTAKTYSFSVIAVDQAGATHTVEELEFDVQKQPKFEVAVGRNRARSGFKFTEPDDASITFIVGETYRFSPLKLIKKDTVVKTGSFEDITYTLIADDGWFVNAQTGEIFGKFAETGRHRMTLLAVDAAGSKDEVEFIVIDVKTRPQFELKQTQPKPAEVTWADVGLASTTVDGDGNSNGDAKVGSDGGSVQYAVGSTIKFPAMALATYDVFNNPAFNEFFKVTYKRSIVDVESEEEATPGLWLVDTGTGEMLAQPEREGTYKASLLATDTLGAEVVVRTWQFEVLKKDTDVPAHGPNGIACVNGITVDNSGSMFDNVFACDCTATGFEGENCEIATAPTECADGEALVDGACRAFVLVVYPNNARTASGDEYTDPALMTAGSNFYTVRDYKSYQFAPLAIDGEATEYSNGNLSDLSYTMTGDTDGFFLNTKNGEMLGTFANYDDTKSVTQQFSITLKAIDGSGVQQALETMVFNVRYPDLQVVEFGPNGKGCENGGAEVDDDGEEFNQAYVCECVTGGLTAYSGENCRGGCLYLKPTVCFKPTASCVSNVNHSLN